MPLNWWLILYFTLALHENSIQSDKKLEYKIPYCLIFKCHNIDSAGQSDKSDLYFKTDAVVSIY